MFPYNPGLSLPCSQTPTEPPQLALMRCFGVVPGTPMPKTSVINLSRLNSRALTVTVYASCLHFYRLRKTRFRRLAKPYPTKTFTLSETSSLLGALIISNFNELLLISQRPEFSSARGKFCYAFIPNFCNFFKRISELIDSSYFQYISSILFFLHFSNFRLSRSH